MLPAGNGMSFRGVIFSENVTITGFSFHFLYDFEIKMQQATIEHDTDTIHHILNLEFIMILTFLGQAVLIS